MELEREDSNLTAGEAHLIVLDDYLRFLCHGTTTLLAALDAVVLAQLYASDFLPEVWVTDDRTQSLRRQVARRAQLVRQRTRLNNESTLATYLILRCPATDPLICSKSRRCAWLAEQPQPLEERIAVEQRLGELDRLGENPAVVDRALGQAVAHEDIS